MSIKPGFYLHIEGALFDHFPLDKEKEARKAAESYAKTYRMKVGMFKVEVVGTVQPAEHPVVWV